MGWIYKITNQVNGKVYIGQTSVSVEHRWAEHHSVRDTETKYNRPLYSAMRKYGNTNFTIETIEEVSEELIAEREIYWIEYYDSYKNGYNATIGGEGVRKIDYDAVVAMYISCQNMTEVAKHFNVASRTISYILKSRNISTLSASAASPRTKGKIVNRLDLEGNYIDTFPSTREAARSIGDEGRHVGIAKVCRGVQQKAFGYKWEYAS